MATRDTPVEAQPYWVGKFPNEAIVVFDQSIQLPGTSHVYLYDLRSGCLKRFPRDAARKVLKKLSSPAAAIPATRDYSAWKTKYGKLVLNPSGHRLNLQQPRKIPRITNCFRCKAPLDDPVDCRCTKCRWLICPNCRACGCHWYEDARLDDD